jgi:hypothetical protein
MVQMYQAVTTPALLQKLLSVSRGLVRTGRSGFDPRQEQRILLLTFCVQTGSEVHPASCTMGTGVFFPGVKRGPGVTLTTYPYLVPRSGMSRSYTSFPPKRLRGV